MKTQLRKINFTSNENEVIEVIQENSEIFEEFNTITDEKITAEDFAEKLRQNRSVVDIEIIIDQDRCVYDYRLWDTYHKLGQNYTYGNGWTNWLMECEIYCVSELKEQFKQLI